MRKELIVLVWLAAPAMAQGDPSEFLLQIRDKVLHALDRLPRYMCTQTINRAQYEPDRYAFVKNCEDLELGRDTAWKLLHTMSDRLRLDVAVAAQREIYSWVGEKQFGDRSLTDIVKEGSISSGYFQGFLELVFRSDNADFSYAGEASEGGKKLVEYRYHVPLESSHYTFSARGHTVTTAYEGAVLADPDTAELVRLTVRTSDLPSESGACDAATAMNYSRFRLNGADFLLPSETDLHIKDLNGTESENRTVYSACHEFLGESTLKFDGAPDAAPQKAAASLAEATIPAGLRFSVALAEDIPVATAAAGDAVKAKLTIDLRSDAKKVLVPKGTLVLCRIVRIRRFYGGKDPAVLGMLSPLQVVELVLRLESFMLPEARRPVFAVVDVGAAGASRRRPGGLKTRPVELGPLNAIGRNQWFARFDRAGDDYVIHSGLASDWVTEAQ
jgi:hypothetical protein